MKAVLLLQFLTIIGLGVLLFVLRKVLLSYLSEKGKNLATKEDIGEITREVESVRAEINQGVEAFKLSLNKELHEFSTQFSRLDHQCATGIMELHGFMCEIEHLLIWQSSAAATTLISLTPEARTMEALNKAWETVAKLDHVLNYHSLLLNEQVYARVQDWSREALAVISAMGNEIEPLRKQAMSTQASLDEREAAIVAITDKHLDTSLRRLGRIRKELEIEFRGILATSLRLPGAADAQR